MIKKPINYIIEVDIKKFFDNINHYVILMYLKEKILNNNFMLIIRRFIKDRIVKHDAVSGSNQAAPQGIVTRPMLTNIYLHYILDLWFKKIVKLKAKGFVGLLIYYNDFLLFCKSKQDANDFPNALQDRLKDFGLSILKEKIRIVKFGRRAWQLSNKRKEKLKTFNFLGFRHYCRKSRRGYFVIYHKTEKSNFSKKLKAIQECFKVIRSQLSLKEWCLILKSKLIGYYNYFDINGNFIAIFKFYHRFLRSIQKLISRRGGKKVNCKLLNNYLQWHQLSMPQVMFYLYAKTSPIKQNSYVEEPCIEKPQAWFKGYHRNVANIFMDM